MSQSNTSRRGLIWMLAALVSIGPLSIDAYLPGLPQLAASLGISIHDAELTISFFLIGFALGQLVGGPVSDQYGRRKTILVGLCIFSAGSLLAALTPSIELLWLARILQAFGGGIGVVNTMGVIRDLFSGKESAQAMSRVVSIMMVAPLLAPFLGSLILTVSNWRAIFALLVAYAIILLLVLMRSLPETHQPNTGPSISPVQRYLEVGRHRGVLGYLFSAAFSHAGMFAFITGSAVVYMGHYDVSASLFPVLFGLNIVTLFGCNRINAVLLNRRPALQLLRMGQRLQLAIGATTLALFLLIDMPLWLLVLMIMLFMGQHGFIMANSVASAVDYFPRSAATSSALITASGFLVGAGTGLLVGLLGDGSPIPMLTIMAACPLLGMSLRHLLHQPLRESGPLQ